MILGIDIGNYSTKSSTGLIFQSKVSKVGNLLNNGIKLNDLAIGEGEFDSEYRKIEKINYFNFLKAAIALSTNDISNKIVLGLPISQFKEDRSTLIHKILTNNIMEFNLNNAKRKIIIEDIEIYPEGIACVDNDFNGIMVDIGGRTTDICIITTAMGKKKVELPSSLPFGTLNLFSAFISSINSRYGLNLKLNDAERILTNGLFIDGTKMDISKHLEFFKLFLEDLINTLNVDYSLKTNQIFFTGGGSVLLSKAIESRFNNAQISEDGIFDNANNFEIVGENLWS